MDDRMARRREQAEAITASPADFKVCEGCGSIVRAPTVICPVCKSYRFDDSQERVVAQAKELGAREPRTITDEDW